MAEHEPPSSPWNKLDALALLAAGVVPALIALRPFKEVDLFWHLAVGRHIAQTGSLPTQNLWSFTAPEHPFAATSWLFDWTFFHLWSRFGPPGLEIAVALVLACVFALTYLSARQWGASRTWSLAMTLTAAILSTPRFAPRPHVISYLFLAIVVFALTVAWRYRRRWPLVAVPLVVALWSNFHAGAVFGAGAMLCFFAAVVWRAWRGGARVLPLAQTGASTVLSWAAVAANPSGVELLRYGVFHLHEVDQVVELAEFLVPSWADYAAFWLLLAVLVFAAAYRLWKSPENALGASWVAAFGFLSGRAIRLVSKFSIVTAPFAAESATRATSAAETRLRTRGWPVAPLRALPWLVPCVAILLSPDSLAHWFRPLALGILPDVYPEATARWAQEHGVSGRCFASWDVSGFVEWRLPESPVFIDPRLRAYPPELFRELVAADEDQARFDALLRKYDVEWSFRGTRWIRLAGIGRFPAKDWALVYWDEAGQVLLRRDIPRFAAIIAENEIFHFRPGANVVEVARSLKPEERPVFEKELRRLAKESPRLVLAHAGLCIQSALRGELGEAVEHCERGSDAVREWRRIYPESRNSAEQLGSAFVLLAETARKQGRPDAARATYERVLADFPNHPGALLGLALQELETDPERARGYVERALRVAPKDRTLLRHHARILERLGDAEGAKAARDRAEAAP